MATSIVSKDSYSLEEGDLDTTGASMPIPDKFHFNRETKKFFEYTPFGVYDVNHDELIKFYNELERKFGSLPNFSDLITDLTEFRLIEPSFYIKINELVEKKVSGGDLVVVENFIKLEEKYNQTMPNAREIILSIAKGVVGSDISNESKMRTGTMGSVVVRKQYIPTQSSQPINVA